MKSGVSIMVAMFAAVFCSAAEFKHAVATVAVSGAWEKDGESSDDTLIVNSKPKGQQVVVSALRLKEAPKDMDQLVDITAQIYQKRMAAFMELSKGKAELYRPETEASESSIVCRCRAYAAKDRVRMLVRIESSATTRIIRSTSIYDYTGMSAEEFEKWSDATLAGVK